MENKGVYKIDGSYGESVGESASGEVFILFGCFLFLLPIIVLTVIDFANIWFLFAFVLITVLFLLILSKFYFIEYDANWFYLKRLFYKTQQISVEDFLEVRRRMFGYLYFVFKDKKVLTIGASKDMFSIWKILMTNKEYNKKHTAEIKNNIEKSREKNKLDNLFKSISE